VIKRVKNKSAFTLIEILIALTIFSLALVLVTGIFSSVLGNQSLISASSKVSRESQRIMRQINDDIISASKTGSVTKNNGGYYSQFVEGLLFLDKNMKIVDPNDLCRLIVSEANLLDSCLADALVLFSDDGIKVYRFKPFANEGTIGDIEYAFLANANQLQVNNSNIVTTNFSFRKLNSEDTEISVLKFWGFGCYKPDCRLSPFSQIFLRVQTKNFDKVSPNKRSVFTLKTRVNKRSYNQ
jgi:prepilin-type N-terminal cleavage/methylation domain-containing protein